MSEHFQMARWPNERDYETRVDRRYRIGAQTKRVRRGCYDVSEIRTPASATIYAETEFGVGKSKSKPAPSPERERWRRKCLELEKLDPWEIALGKK